MIEPGRLTHLAKGYGITVDDEMRARFSLYARLLEEWNVRINLTAITQPEEVEIKHFLDCLLLAACPEAEESLADVGSGAGFPGLVVKIFKPKLSVTLIEPTGKRVRFLQMAAEALGLPVEVICRRAEEVGRRELREDFRCVTARAVAAMPVLCEYCLPLVQVGGAFIAMKGGDEPLPDLAMLAKLGGEAKDALRFTLPDGSERSLIVVKKVSPTPVQYPRNGGVIAKRPLG